MNFTDALEQALLDADAPVITAYGLFVLGRNLFEQRDWRGEPLKRMPPVWDQAGARNAISRLVERRFLVSDVDFGSGVWRVVQSARSGSAEEVACIADPFAYVSHLSAMQRYGLTERSPGALHLTTPARAVWNRLRDEKVGRELAGVPEGERPSLSKPGFSDTIRRRPVLVHETRHPAAPVSVRGESARVTSIGRTFADMLSEPGLCGGVRHVLDIWERDAEQWAPEIIGEVDRVHSQIVKVRAGYLLSEVLGVEDPRIDGWRRFAQRGGSRKLDPDGPYAPRFSDAWMISLNA